MEPTRDFQQMIAQVREGCPDARQQLYEEFKEYVLTVVRPRLKHSLRRIYESADIAQAVWASFFNDDLGERIFPSPAALKAFLKSTARNKVLDCYRKRYGAPGTNREPEQELEHPSWLLSNDPTPSKIVRSQEDISSLLSELPKHHQAVYYLLREGYNANEIADFVGISSRQIRRLIRHIERALQKATEDSD